ncbi:hypothetical protein X801_06637, partial [Opisthorchis viverrini]
MIKGKNSHFYFEQNGPYSTKRRKSAIQMEKPICAELIQTTDVFMFTPSDGRNIMVILSGLASIRFETSDHPE